MQVPNEKGELVPGMFVQLRFKLTSAQPLLLVPSNAPIIRADSNLLAVVDAQNRVHLQKVTFGRDFGSQIEITSGLTEGALVVANPSDALGDGEVVEPLKPEVKNYTVFDVSARLREFGWLVPAYTFPENRQDLSVLRVVVRAGLTNDMADLFLNDVRKQTAWLESLESPMPKRRPEELTSFSH